MLDKFRRRLARPAAAESTTGTLPPVEQINEDDDVSCFLRAEVPEDVRRAALRHLFRQPKFNRRDGLDDYDDDYRLVGDASPEDPEPLA